MNERPNKDRNPQRNVPQKPANAPGKDDRNIDKEGGGWEDKNRPGRKENIGDPTKGPQKGGFDKETYERETEEDNE